MSASLADAIQFQYEVALNDREKICYCLLDQTGRQLIQAFSDVEKRRLEKSSGNDSIQPQISSKTSCEKKDSTK